MDADEKSSQLTPAPGPPALPRVEMPWVGCRVWRYYQPRIRAEMSCCQVETENGSVLIDPFEEMLPLLSADGRKEPPSAILLTNGNHERAVHKAQALLQVPVFAPLPAARQHFDQVDPRWHDAASPDLPPPLCPVSLPGFGPGEYAFFDPRNGGSLHVGDALIHLPGYGFALLPPKYCENVTTALQSLRDLCRWDFVRMTFAHGAPITSGAGDFLANLLESIPESR